MRSVSARGNGASMADPFKSRLLFVLAFLACSSLCLGQSQTQAQGSASETSQQGLAGSEAQRMLGSITGTVADQSGAVIAGARVELIRSGQPQVPNQETLSDGDGQFSFANIATGPFQITIASSGFASQTVSGTLLPGEIHVVPQIALAVATNVTETQVGVSQADVAEEQIKVQEKQRVLGVLPNFYVSYIPNPVPLTSKQKFKLAWKTSVDPFTFVFVGVAAGVEQAQNSFPGYGQGAAGYAKRFGATYGDLLSGTFIGAAILPSVLKQDPRYFYRGSGSKSSRILYALASSVVCRGDNGRQQVNYSNMLGSLAAGGISNLYHPADNRNRAALTFENAAIAISATAVANVFQEFFSRKLTPKAPSVGPDEP